MLPTILRRIPARSVLSSRAASTVAVSQISPNIKVTAFDEGAHTSSLSVILKAGSRFENAAGVANVLKNSAFKSNRLTSALGTVRAAEHAGGVLSATLTREHLALTAEFLKGDESLFLNILAASLTPRLLSYELKENTIPTAVMEATAATASPSIAALEAAHSLTFRNGLGNSIFASQEEPVSVLQLQAFWEQVIAGEIAVVGTGMSQESLENLVKHVFAEVINEDTKGSQAVGESYEGMTDEQIKTLKEEIKTQTPAAQTAALSQLSYQTELINLKTHPNPASLVQTADPSSKTFGGEIRIPIDLHQLPDIQPTLLIAYGSLRTSAEHVLLPYILGVESSAASLKWSPRLSPLAKAASVVGDGASAQAFNQAYSDANLLCVEVVAEGTKRLSQAGKEVVKALNGVKITEESLKRAVGQAKLDLARKWETSEGVRELLAKEVFTGKVTSVEESFKAFDKVSTTSINKVLSDLLKSKPSIVSVARLSQMAYSDELGL